MSLAATFMTHTSGNYQTEGNQPRASNGEPATSGGTWIAYIIAGLIDIGRGSIGLWVSLLAQVDIEYISSGDDDQRREPGLLFAAIGLDSLVEKSGTEYHLLREISNPYRKPPFKRNEWTLPTSRRSFGR